MDTIEKFEELKKVLYDQIDKLDSTYETCNHCGRNTYSNRRESLLRVDLRRIVRNIDQKIEEIQNNTPEED